MTVFDKIYLFVFTRYKTHYKSKANTLALLYMSLFQISLLFLLGCFFMAFLSQMHVDVLSSTNAWVAFVLLSVAIHFKNWISYSGQTRKVLNAKWNKIKTPKYNLILLLALPIVATILGFVFLQAT